VTNRLRRTPAIQKVYLAVRILAAIDPGAASVNVVISL
jgi:hypothetical protein